MIEKNVKDACKEINFMVSKEIDHIRFEIRTEYEDRKRHIERLIFELEEESRKRKRERTDIMLELNMQRDKMKGIKNEIEVVNGAISVLGKTVKCFVEVAGI